MNTENDQRIILTLDAGGTNFVFSAIRGNAEIVEPLTRPAWPHDLEKCLASLVEGFESLNRLLPEPPVAISFAFPGPADYPAGIIGDLPNFKAFTEGVALGPMLEDHFGIPVFINNDGSLFAYGEALSGYLPMLNEKIRKAGGIKQFQNLIGLTLGTGFGCGIVTRSNQLLEGDNSCDAGIHATLNKFNSTWYAEESVSTRAIQRVYAEVGGFEFDDSLMPKDIYEIALEKKAGEADAAKTSFRVFGEALGSSIANISTLVDGIIVLGGGITAAWELFAGAMFTELNRWLKDFRGNEFQRLPFEVYNLEKQEDFARFASGQVKELKVPGSGRTVQYDSNQRTGIGLSMLGASKAVALGAYAFALEALKENQ
ncbi:MAG: ROK family protein [Bacteroidota bacterium]|nr:ROK family protein [Bacteroidota bacterium]